MRKTFYLLLMLALAACSKSEGPYGGTPSPLPSKFEISERQYDYALVSDTVPYMDVLFDHAEVRVMRRYTMDGPFTVKHLTILEGSAGVFHQIGPEWTSENDRNLFRLEYDAGAPTNFEVLTTGTTTVNPK